MTVNSAVTYEMKKKMRSVVFAVQKLQRILNTSGGGSRLRQLRSRPIIRRKACPCIVALQCKGSVANRRLRHPISAGPKQGIAYCKGPITVPYHLMCSPWGPRRLPVRLCEPCAKLKSNELCGANPFCLQSPGAGCSRDAKRDAMQNAHSVLRRALPHGVVWERLLLRAGRDPRVG